MGLCTVRVAENSIQSGDLTTPGPYKPRNFSRAFVAIANETVAPGVVASALLFAIIPFTTWLVRDKTSLVDGLLTEAPISG